VIIRGVKAGLPLGDCMRVIASESAEPVRTEFRLMVEATALGLSLGEATERIVERFAGAGGELLFNRREYSAEGRR